MGADGGVCWVDVKDRDRFLELAEPLGFVCWDDYHWSNVEWLENLEERPENRVFGTYGTGQDLDLLDIKDALTEVEWLLESEENPGHWGWAYLTFEDLVLDVKTRPEGLSGVWALDKVAKYVEFRLEVQKEDPVYLMTVREWVEEIRDVIDRDSFGSVETWT